MKRKGKARHMVAFAIVALSVAVTPHCIALAAQQRGYTAYGGEWLVVPLGMLMAYVVVESANAWDAWLKNDIKD